MVAKLAPLVVIAGETASGKSSLGLYLAEKFDGEIIAADSWTVRQDVDIGTAKPTKQEQAKIPHHMLDVVPACGDYTAALFKEQALEVIQDISSRGKLPIMVGGTGLYIDSVIFDYSFLDDTNNHYDREELNNKTLEELIEYVKNKNLPLDRIDTRNKRRVIRLIETDGDEPTRGGMRGNTLVIGRLTNRDSLAKRVEERTEEMIKLGLEDEVRKLANKYGWQCEALKGIGYIEWKPYFEGVQSLEATKEQIISNTMKLAKRQRTWFKRNKSIQYIEKQSEAVELVTTLLDKS